MRHDVAVVFVFVAAALAAAADTIRRYLGLCPPASHKLLLLRVGANRTDASEFMTPAVLWPWRPPLAEELGIALVRDADGRAIRCAATDQLVYTSDSSAAAWQWAPEAVGHQRQVSIRGVAFVDAPPGSSETPEELSARTDGGSIGVAPQTHPVTLETLSASPPIFRARGLVPEAVLTALLEHATPSLHPSTVGDPTLPGQQTVKRIVDDRRTSRSAWLHGFNDPRHTLAAARYVQRVAMDLLRHDTPRRKLLTHIEPLLVVDYAPGEFYEPHHDFFAGGGSRTAAAEEAYAPAENGSNRFATLLLYLESPDAAGAPDAPASSSSDDNGRDAAGGHTVFPFAAPSNVSSYFADVAFAGTVGAPSCAFPALRQERGLMVAPRRGDAVLFYSQTPEGALDGRSRHGACPVARGRKAACNVWVWNREAIYR